MELDNFNLQPEKEPLVRKFEAVKIADGLGFGDGTISLEDRVESGDNAIDNETVQKVETTIDSDEILVPIEADDDGCGDGRGVKRIFKGMRRLKRSLNRAKVFGGGSTMGVAAKVGLGEASGQSLNGLFSRTIESFKKHSIAFGAHTADHASGEDSGCGAIDQAPLVIANVRKFKDKITGAINLLTGGNYEKVRLDSVFMNYGSYDEAITDDVSYSGKKVAEEIMDNDNVVKELEGPHLETHLVINTVNGYTVNQELIREVSDGKAQVFGVDEWRIREIAEKMYKEPAKVEQAYLSMLVYTLATAAALTKGDQPVFMIKKANHLVAV